MVDFLPLGELEENLMLVEARCNTQAVHRQYMMYYLTSGELNKYPLLATRGNM